MEDAQMINQILNPLIDTSEIIQIRDEIVQATDKVYVAVGTHLKDCRSTLLWALQNSGGSQICILHVHQPAEPISFVGQVNHLQSHQVTAYHETDRQDMHQLLDKYKQICQDTGVCVEVQYIEMDSIEKGIVEFILQHNVRRLVMGATRDTQYSRMVDLRSKKAIYVCLQAAASCQIQLICKGKVIFTRKGWLYGADEPYAPISSNTNADSGKSFLSSTSVNTNTDSGQSSSSARSVSEGQYFILHPDNLNQDYGAITRFNEDIQLPSPSSVVQERGINDELYDQLVQAMAEADNSKREALEESIRRRKAEKDVAEAKLKVIVAENLHAEELRRRQEVDATLEKTKEELHVALEQKSFLESQNADFVDIVHELEQAMFSADDQLHNYKKERDELKVECDDALRLVEELTEKHAEEASTSSVSHFYTEFDLSEVKDATRDFDQSLKIGNGSYADTYKGFLRHTEVVVKVFYPHNFQVPSEFQQEVNLLSKVRHPNLVTLIGTCPDAWMIIYEYLSGGSLEDRLNCKDNTPSLSWQNRIRVAAELCSVLIFLHSCGIIHGNLKPSNLLLDRNLVTKLTDFGIHRELSQNEVPSNNTSPYMDPESLSTGEFTTKSDAFSFGIILLRLLTGKPPLGLRNVVQSALNNENLKNILDSTAGDWPFVQAQQLTVLAINCCDAVSTNRPDLATEAWRVLDPIRVSCGLSSFRLGSEGQREVPHYFVCPIFQEAMQDPVVAADGFTYEAEALKGWLDSGHNTSPMTNLELANSNLVPNHALRSAIQEWLQQP